MASQSSGAFGTVPILGAREWVRRSCLSPTKRKCRLGSVPDWPPLEIPKGEPEALRRFAPARSEATRFPCLTPRLNRGITGRLESTKDIR